MNEQDDYKWARIGEDAREIIGPEIDMMSDEEVYNDLQINELAKILIDTFLELKRDETGHLNCFCEKCVDPALTELIKPKRRIRRGVLVRKSN
jgi:hypothetical protein